MLAGMDPEWAVDFGVHFPQYYTLFLAFFEAGTGCRAELTIYSILCYNNKWIIESTVIPPRILSPQHHVQEKSLATFAHSLPRGREAEAEPRGADIHARTF